MPLIRSTRFWIILAIVFVAGVLHLWAIARLPVDFDEPDYVQAGYGYAAELRAGDVAGVVDYEYNREHPPLVKLTYGLGILALGEKANWATALYAARLISAVFGVLAVLILALVDPLAGALLAVHTLAIKYTSQAYLEALPLFAGLAAVLALTRWRGGRDRWLWLSAIALGTTAAGKFTYFPVAFPIFYLLVIQKRPRWLDVFLYLGVAAASFLALNPRLWHDPATRFADMILFHVNYSQGYNVARSGYPWYQPFLWLAQPVPWHPEVFFYGGLDGIVFWLAVAGAFLERRARPWVTVWLVGGMIVLLLWPTKWPQYALVLAPPLCLAAASALRTIWEFVRNWEDRWNVFRNLFPAPSRGFLVVVGLAVAGLLVGMVANSFRTALGQMPWSHLTAETTPLPGNSVHEILALSDGRMALGTGKGLALWTQQAATDVPDRWDVFTQAAGLPADDVQALAEDAAGRLWVGTPGGMGRYDGETWQVYKPSEFGLRGDRVNAFAVDRAGRLWVGGDGGAAVFDGVTWQAYTAASGHLPSDYVLALAIEQPQAGDVVWFGLMDGISRLDTATGQWTHYTSEEARLGPGGVGALFVDSAGRLWAGSLGGGVSRWDGTGWSSLRTSDLGLPNYTVQAIFEAGPGSMWIGTALPLMAGGTLSAYDGSDWRNYTADNSGYSGAEPLTIALDRDGRLWVGTQTAGVDILRLER